MIKRNRPSKTIQGVGVFSCILLVLLASLLFPGFASAQSPEPIIQIDRTDNRNFPEIKVEFSGKNLTGRIYPSADDVTIIENGHHIRPDFVERIYTGIHFSLVINPESSLTLHWANGLQYYAEMINAIKSIGPDLDNLDVNRYSLYINPDISYTEMTSYDAWAKAINEYSINQRNLVSSLDSLEMAISALETSGTSLDSVLVYLTPYLHPTLLPGFFSLAERAAAINVPIHVWIVMSQSMLGTSYETNLRDALLKTGGTLSTFTGLEEVPDPNTYLQGKGESFLLTYQSMIRESGSFDLAVELSLAADRVLRSKPTQLDLIVEPMQVSFINPPDSLDLLQDEDNLVSPDSLPIEVLIEFPDGYPRSILSSILFVNGTRVQTNQSPPYGSFAIDLNDYTQEQKLLLEVRINDDLGLQGKTPIHTLNLNIFKPQKTFSGSWFASPWLWLVLVGLLSIIIVLILRKPRRIKREKDTSTLDSNKKNPNEVLLKPASTVVKSFGSLMKLDPDQTPSAEKPYLLVKEITLIGRDPSLANLVLDDPMLEPLHAEIHFFSDGRIRITDFNSISGTYVNFKPVTSHGTSLQHADLVHFGSLLFRFNSVTRTQSTAEKDVF